MSSPSPQPDSLPSPPEFTFANADIRLRIAYKGSEAYAHVSSQALALASPVWKNFLFPPWGNPVSTTPYIDNLAYDGYDREAQYIVARIKEELKKFKSTLAVHPVQELDFTEDNAEALLVLLCVAHMKFSFMPTGLPSRELLIQIAILCKQYICAEMMAPFVQGWLNREFCPDNRLYGLLDRPEATRAPVEDCLYLMFIAFVFKLPKFEIAASWLFHECHLGQLDSIRKIPQGWPVPGTFIDDIIAAREKLIKAFYAIADDLHEALKPTQLEKCLKHDQTCKILWLPDFKRRFSYHGLPFPLRDNYSQLTVRDLYRLDFTSIELRSCVLDMDRKLFHDAASKAKSTKELVWNELYEKIRPTAPGGRTKVEGDDYSGRIEAVTGLWLDRG
ncbi:uncharacterized protein LY89DRAFT_790537 [Mollisia scopiformis]|uniref:BTB domain-containing protein n=1 Tax=Mollisia scopiformis TaxID=149040 RepID=A0A132B2V3_MOLSC|nr:uncharacterized protein LY89DRAFT_790537 [Mollisia scopiformis]KUJ06369.1 hypothetical protein LY89DRAFT_790537 [Mollisia scopiformis]